MDIQWYPGHMTKAKRMLEKQLALIDIAVELCDARLPQGSRNPDLDALIGGKRRILVLNKSDLADPVQTKAWLGYFRQRGVEALAFDSSKGRGGKEVTDAIQRVMQPVLDRQLRKGVRKITRAMVVGIPNVGKSTFTNRLYGGPATRVGDRPGVTRGRQWVTVNSHLEFLDTPGLLWPKQADREVALNLAFLGSIRDEILDTEALCARLLERLARLAPDALRGRLKLADVEGDGEALLERACFARGWIMSGGVADRQRGAAVVLDEFRAGRMGRITLERAPTRGEEAR